MLLRGRDLPKQHLRSNLEVLRYGSLGYLVPRLSFEEDKLSHHSEEVYWFDCEKREADARTAVANLGVVRGPGSTMS